MMHFSTGGQAWNETAYFLMALIASGIVGASAAFPLSYLSGSNVLIGICLLPLVIFVSGASRFNYFYFFTMLAFGGLACVYHIKVFYFFTLAFYFIFLLELCLGRVNPLVLFLLVMISPVFLQVAVILGFPIRLHLSQWAGTILKLAGLNVQVEGNMMTLNGAGFTVDEACMGLSMLAISMLMGIFIIAHQYKTRRLKLSLKHLSVFFLVVFILNLVSNLLRIIVLVTFKILPGDPMHDAMGIACLVVYVVIPLYWVAKWMVSSFGKSFETPPPRRPLMLRVKMMLAMLAVAVIAAGFVINPRKAEAIPHANVSLAGMQAIKMEGGITKMFSDDLLVYVKPIPEFFSSEHTPLICWKGSGYGFASVKKTFIGKDEIYCGVLSKGSERLYTAWWYTNGKVSTIDQLVWRSIMLHRGDRFCLVNITAKDEYALHVRLRSIFENNLISIQ